MQTYLLDTNHAGEVLKKESGGLKFPGSKAGENIQLTLCYPSVAELWFMVHNSCRVSANIVSLRFFLTCFPIYSFDGRAAEEFGVISAQLRKLGRPIKAVDTQIAAIARVNGLTVLTADRHFSFIPGVKYESWL